MSGSRPGRVDGREVPPDTPVRFGWREPGEHAGGNVPARLVLTTPATGPTAADETAIASGRRVILEESEGLGTLARAIDGSFAAVVALLAEVAGRVVVTGMGKSGHVACKIAATLASTGTPALYVHPAEASHGDLGMITAQDAVLALSNSGETTELRDLILYTRRFSIPLIGLVGRAPSTLAEAADLTLLLPEVGEACPMGLAPTTSTTCMLALGDALAVALLERRGFSPHDFAVFHPGGKLGSQLLRVEQLMHRGDDLPLIGPEASLADAVLQMTRKRLGCVGVRRGRAAGRDHHRRRLAPAHGAGHPEPHRRGDHDPPPAHDRAARARGRGRGGDERAASPRQRAVRGRG